MEKKISHNQEISFSLSLSDGWLKYFTFFFYSTAPVRKESCRDLKIRTSNIGNPKCRPEFWSSLPPAMSLIFKKNVTMAEDLGIMAETHRSLRAITKSSKEFHWPCFLDLPLITITVRAVTKPSQAQAHLSLMWVSLVKALGFTRNWGNLQTK